MSISIEYKYFRRMKILKWQIHPRLFGERWKNIKRSVLFGENQIAVEAGKKRAIRNEHKILYGNENDI